MHGFGVAGERTWTTPELTGVNRLAMRSPLVPFPDEAGARSGIREDSPWFRGLDGRWWFRLVDRPEDAPGDFAVPDLDPAGAWRPIEVPGVWTTQGWDRPIYTNIRMPFEGRPPEVPDANPTGLYRTTFRVPREWRDRRVVLHLGGAISVLYVYVNGVPVGMSKDARLPSEFDITDQLQTGPNTLACMVVRWSDASYVEDQDQWWHAGLHREVFLYARGRTHIADLHLATGLDGDDLTVGTLELGATVEFSDAADIGPGWRIEARIETVDGKSVLVDPLSGEVPHDLRPYLFSGHDVSLQARIDDVAPWSAEEPTLYRAVVSLIDPQDAVREVVTERFGFTRIEVRDNELLVNGQPVMIHGVNRHDHHPRTGPTVSVEDMRADLETMKRFNVNAVRTAHYPNDHRFLDLCDELGLYVIDEADIESHAYITTLCHDPRYLAAFVDRGSRMVQRDKNHACVIAWSLGNESGYGAHHDAMAAWIRRYDRTRPLHYEGALMFDLYADAPVTDIVCPMYASIDDIVGWATSGRDRRRPLILCEYSHAMGNSNGSLADYFDAFEQHHGLQGGFIWEWKDHGLRAAKADGTEYFAYGGQFGDEPNDANFVADGLCGPDGSPHPALWEHKFLAAPVAVTATDAALRKRRIRIENRRWFRDLTDLVAAWELAVDGTVIEKGSLDLPPIEARSVESVEVPFGRPSVHGDQEVTLTVRFRTRHVETWAPRGFEVAWHQLVVPIAARSRSKAVSARSMGAVAIDRDPIGGKARVSVGSLEVEIDEATGELDSLRWDGDDVVLDAPRIDLWRAPTDNDGIKAFLDRDDVWSDESAKPLARWLDWGLDALHRSPVGATVKARVDGGLTVVARHKVWGSEPNVVMTHRQQIDVLASGDVVFGERLDVPAMFDDLPRIGVRFRVARGFERLEWFGPGPWETYADRKAGAALGRWDSTVTDGFVPYLVPQEHGAHIGTRWFALEHPGLPASTGGRRATGLLVAAVGGSPIMFSASHHAAEDLFAARDLTELAPRPEVFVHVDAAQRGLGTLSCGPDILPRYRLGPGTHRWQWRLRPYTPRNDDPAELAREALG